MFLCGTGVQVSPVIELDHRPVGSGQVGPIGRLIRDRYFDAVRGRLDAYRHWLTPIDEGRLTIGRRAGSGVRRRPRVAAPPGLTASDIGFDPTRRPARRPLAGDGGAAVAILPAIDASPLETVVPAIAAGDPFRARPRPARSSRSCPGLVSWLLILSPLLLSFRFPEVVAWFVLTFDFYWLYKAVVLTGSVCVAFGRIRQTTAARLADPGARPGRPRRPPGRDRPPRRRSSGPGSTELAPGAVSGWPPIGGRRELDRLERERRDLIGLLARRGDAAARPAPALPRGARFRPTPSRSRSCTRRSARWPRPTTRATG